MFTTEEKERYSRHILVEEIGEKGQQKLKNARVLVVGSGGLGCPILQYLAAAGIGTIGIVDDDTVEKSNLQRQVLFTENDLGKPKVTIAATHLKAMNANLHVQPFYERLTEKNALQLFSQFDIIVEGSDSFTTKYLVNDSAVLCKKPFVLGSIYKFEGQVSVFNFQNGPTYRCLFPEPLSPEKMPTCSEIGVLGVLPGVMGTLMANEVLKIILGIGIPLSGKLLKLNLLSLEQQIFSFQKDNSIHIKQLQPIDFSCKTFLETIAYADYKSKAEKYYLLDVRTKKERNHFSIGGKHIPLAELKNQLTSLSLDKPVVVYCASGIRSKKAIEILQHHYPKNKFLNLKGGIKQL